MRLAAIACTLAIVVCALIFGAILLQKASVRSANTRAGGGRGAVSAGGGDHGRSWLRRADRSSISSFHLADLGGEAD